MAFNHTLSAIMRGRWFLDKSWANDHFPLVLLMLQGKQIDFGSASIDRKGSPQGELPFAVDPATMSKHPLYVYDPRTDRVVPNANIPENSVGILTLTGPITKYNGECGEPGAIQRTSWLNELERRQNISSVIQLMDTPGGEVQAAYGYSDALRNYSKPTLSFIDGMCASLGMFYSTSTNETHFSNEMGTAGSIGAYTTIVDFSEALANAGIKITDVYAPQSSRKNEESRAADNGDMSQIETLLERMVNNFIGSVKTGRPKSARYEKEWSTGRMFTAQEAIDVKLVDGILTFEQAVQKAAWLAKRKK